MPWPWLSYGPAAPAAAEKAITVGAVAEWSGSPISPNHSPLANTATVSGTVSSITFESSDTAEVTDTNPGITVDKSPDVQSLPADGNVTFTISVTNTGAVDLRKTAVTDTAVPGCGRTATQVRALPNNKGKKVGFLLKLGESFTFTCSVSGISDDFSNTAAAQGVADGVSIQHSDTAVVTATNPGIEIDKTPDTQPVPGGGNATFTIAVTNVTDVDIRKTTVTDAATPACGRTGSQVRALLNGHGNSVGFLLKPGETFTNTCVATGISDTFINTAAAQGIADGITIQDTAIATIENPPP